MEIVVALAAVAAATSKAAPLSALLFSFWVNDFLRFSKSDMPDCFMHFVCHTDGASNFLSSTTSLCPMAMSSFAVAAASVSVSLFWYATLSLGGLGVDAEASDVVLASLSTLLPKNVECPIFAKFMLLITSDGRERMLW